MSSDPLAPGSCPQCDADVATLKRLEGRGRWHQVWCSACGFESPTCWTATAALNWWREARELKLSKTGDTHGS